MRRQRTVRASRWARGAWLSLAGAVLAAVACSSSTTTPGNGGNQATTCTAPRGTLQVTVTPSECAACGQIADHRAEPPDYRRHQSRTSPLRPGSKRRTCRLRDGHRLRGQLRRLWRQRLWPLHRGPEQRIPSHGRVHHRHDCVLPVRKVWLRPDRELRFFFLEPMLLGPSTSSSTESRHPRLAQTEGTAMTAATTVAMTLAATVATTRAATVATTRAATVATTPGATVATTREILVSPTTLPAPGAG